MRKSILMAGSALAVAGLTTAGAQKAEAAEFSLGLYMPFVIGGADSDFEPESQIGMGTTDTEFYVTASETLENGINVAVKFQFDAVGDVSTNNTDETEIEISGSFGLISLGHEDGPADLLNLGATKVKTWAFGSFANTTGVPVNYTRASSFAGQLGGSATSNEAGLDTGDNVKFAYYTPRFQGLQAGVAIANTSEIIGQAGTVSVSASGALVTAPPANETGYELGVNYQNTFDGIDVGLAASYFYQNQGPTQVQDPERWSVGALLGYEGFTVSGQYSDGERGSGADVMTWDIGLGYTTGPWGFHAVYEYGEVDYTAAQAGAITFPMPLAMPAIPAGSFTSAEGESHMVHVGVSYALGPGVSVGGSIGIGEDEGKAAGPAISTSIKNDYVVFTTGIVVSF